MEHGLRFGVREVEVGGLGDFSFGVGDDPERYAAIEEQARIIVADNGASEPTVANALLRLLGNCAALAGNDPGRYAAIEEQAQIIMADAEREVAQPADLGLTHAQAESVLHAIAMHRPTVPSAGRQPDEPPAPAPAT
jgi:hypothetical protein